MTELANSSSLEATRSVALAAAVVATPKRLPTIPERMAQRLSCPTYVIVDRAMRGMWFNYRRCMLWDYPPEVTHVLIMEDDVEVCADLAETALHVAALWPGVPVNLMNIWQAMLDRCNEAGAPFWKTQTSFCTQAIVFPRDLLREAVRWIDKHIVANGFTQTADVRLGVFFQVHGMWMPTTAVSLVEHKRGLSVFGTPKIIQPVSHAFIGKEGRGLALEWGIAQGAKLPVRRGADVVKMATLNLKGVVPWEYYYDHKEWDGETDLHVNGLFERENVS